MRRLLLLGMLLLTLTGCIDYSEELWLNRDGSGRVKMSIGVLTSYENKQEINRYLEQPGISLISKSVYRKDKHTFYKIELRFSSIEAFNNLSDQVSNADFLGRLTLNKEDDGTYILKRRIALGSLSGDEDEIEQLIFSQPLNNLKWSYKIHLPWKIIKANAAPENINYEDKSVSWEYKTAYLLNQSQIMVVTMQPSLPVKTILLVALAVLVAVISLLWWRRSLRKHRGQSPRSLPEDSPQQ
jgi:hypothetical protein